MSEETVTIEKLTADHQKLDADLARLRAEYEALEPAGREEARAKVQAAENVARTAQIANAITPNAANAKTAAAAAKALETAVEAESAVLARWGVLLDAIPILEEQRDTATKDLEKARIAAAAEVVRARLRAARPAIRAFAEDAALWRTLKQGLTQPEWIVDDVFYLADITEAACRDLVIGANTRAQAVRAGREG